jgi:cardiolipin synthase (CMP-forming)
VNAAFRRDIVLLPNLVSLGRIVLICIAAVIFLVGHPLAALLVGVPAGLSDYLDGWLARRRGETTELGALLDGLADILFTLVCLTIAQLSGAWPAYLLIAWGFRDMTVMVMRASAGQQGFVIRSSYLAKVAVNFTAYSFVLMALDIARPIPALATGIHWLGLLGVHAGIAMQWISGAGYLAEYMRKYKGQ